MARQKGLHKILGTIGDATYSKTADGYQVKEKSEISKAKFQASDTMARTRENASEFGRAGQAGKLLRLAIRTLLKYGKDNRVVARLTGQMLKVIKTDAVSTRGMRNVMDGEAELLKGFEFNKNATLSMSFPVETVPLINRTTGELSVQIPEFVPLEDITAPEGTTHFKLVSLGSAVNFESNTFETVDSNSNVLPYNHTAVPTFTLQNNLTANSTNPLFLLFGIQFFQQVNGINYPLKNGAYNTLAIVDVSGI